MEAKESMGKSGIPENVEKQKYLKLWKVSGFIYGDLLQGKAGVL